MARHRGKARHPVVIGAGVLLVAALAVGGGYAVMNRGDAGPPASGAAATSTSPGSTSPGGSPSSGTSSSSTASASGASPSTASASGAASVTTPSSTSTSASPAGADAPAVAALDSCTAMVRAQQALATAVAASARDWRLHTDAQRKFDSGAFTMAQTEAQWAASKARGPADLAAYARAVNSVKAVKRAGAGCDGLAAAASGSSVEASARRCATRSASLARVARTGAVVHRQWAAHLAMMAHKEHTGAAEYLDRWAGMVKAAGPALSAHRSAAAALAKAPACPS